MFLKKHLNNAWNMEWEFGSPHMSDTPREEIVNSGNLSSENFERLRPFGYNHNTGEFVDLPIDGWLPPNKYSHYDSVVRPTVESFRNVLYNLREKKSANSK